MLKVEVDSEDLGLLKPKTVTEVRSECADDVSISSVSSLARISYEVASVIVGSLSCWARRGGSVIALGRWFPSE